MPSELTFRGKQFLLYAEVYTILFITTKRLPASIVAHGVYNVSAILWAYVLYYQQ